MPPLAGLPISEFSLRDFAIQRIFSMRFKGASSESTDLLEVLEAAAGDFLRTGAGETLVVRADFFMRGAGDFLTGTGDFETGRDLEDLGRRGSGDFFFGEGDFFLASAAFFYAFIYATFFSAAIFACLRASLLAAASASFLAASASFLAASASFLKASFLATSSAALYSA